MLADGILGWSEALDCHEQSDALNAAGYFVEIVPIAIERSCKKHRVIIDTVEDKYQIQERVSLCMML